MLAAPPPEHESSLARALTSIEASPSRLQNDVAAMLETLGIAHEHELVLPEGLSVDFLLPASPGASSLQPTVVEVDGPSHFLHEHSRGRHSGGNQRPLENGPTLFKQRLMRSMGYRVVQLPYFEWPKSAVERQSYLRELLLPAA